jgi:hypothetical protein
MALSVFDRREDQPSDEALALALGRTYAMWRRLTEDLCGDTVALEPQWAFAGEKFGWSLRLKHGKRIIVYLTPQRGHFLASFSLGKKAYAAAREQGLPHNVLTLIDEAPQYAEGRGVRIPVRAQRDAHAIATLARIKQDTR